MTEERRPLQEAHDPIIDHLTFSDLQFRSLGLFGPSAVILRPNQRLYVVDDATGQKVPVLAVYLPGMMTLVVETIMHKRMYSLLVHQDKINLLEFYLHTLDAHTILGS